MFTVFHEEIDYSSELTPGVQLADAYQNVWYVSEVRYRSVTVVRCGRLQGGTRYMGTINWKPGLRIEMARQAVQAYRARHQRSHRPMPEFSYV